MNVLKQFGIILGLNYAGGIIQSLLGIPIPGNVIGFVLLFLLLSLKVVKIQDVEDVIKVILLNLAFLFVPASTSLMTSFDLLKDAWIQIVLICVVSTIIAMGVTGWIVQLMLKRSEKNGNI